jgi:hypothetical protein
VFIYNKIKSFVEFLSKSYISIGDDESLTKNHRQLQQNEEQELSNTFSTSLYNQHLPFSESNASHVVIPLKIGIGIRVGDHSFHPDIDATNTSLSSFEHFFQCATHLEQSFLSSSSSMFPIPMQQTKELLNDTSKIKWYMMAESLKLRQLVDQRFNIHGPTTVPSVMTNPSLSSSTQADNRKVITDANTLYFHGDCNKRNYYGSCDRESLDMAIITAVAQLTLFSMCDVHIITPDSGFPRIAAMLAKPPQRIYMMGEKYRKETNSYYCQLGNHSTWQRVAKIGCGV